MIPMITRDEQKKIHAILRKMAKSLGQSEALLREQLKERFAEAMDYPDGKRFSLKLNVCTEKEYELFKEFVLDLAMDYGADIGKPEEYFDDIEQYVSLCIKYRVCCVTGRKHDLDSGIIVDIHHVDAIGMGNDRRKADHAKLRRMPLTREMHTLIHKIGYNAFVERYHVVGVLTKYRTGKDAVEDYIDVESRGVEEAKQCSKSMRNTQ